MGDRAWRSWVGPHRIADTAAVAWEVLTAPVIRDHTIGEDGAAAQDRPLDPDAGLRAFPRREAGAGELCVGGDRRARVEVDDDDVRIGAGANRSLAVGEPKDLGGPGGDEIDEPFEWNAPPQVAFGEYE